MDNKTLAVKYRPNSWEDLTEQEYIKNILENQIKTNTVKNAYLFCGPAGCGKTTSARIFAKEINENQGNPIEIDAASNNGVEQIRVIIDEAKFAPIDCKYKIYILDECHMLSVGAWNAMLKLLEEPPKTTIFILCTTDPQKIPKTILSRVQRYDFQKISFEGIVKRLKYIIEQENKECKPTLSDPSCLETIEYEKEALEYIAKVAEGGMRDAISMLDKCLSYSNKLTVENIIKALGISDYDSLYRLLFLLCVGDKKACVDIIENVYRQGKDLKLFIKQLIQFNLEVCKYLIYDNFDYIQIPNTINLDQFKLNNISGNYDLLLNILDEILKLNNDIKYESNPKILIQSKILLICKGV